MKKAKIPKRPSFYDDDLWWRIVKLVYTSDVIYMLADRLGRISLLHKQEKHHGYMLSEHFGNSLHWLLMSLKEKENIKEIITLVKRLEKKGEDAIKTLNGLLPKKQRCNETIVSCLGDWR